MLSWLITKALAQTLVPVDGDPRTPDCGFAEGNMNWYCVPQYIQFLANVIVTFTLSICLIMIMINGYRYVLGPAMGESSNENAKRGIVNALIGSAVALLAYLIIDIILVTLSS